MFKELASIYVAGIFCFFFSFYFCCFIDKKKSEKYLEENFKVVVFISLLWAFLLVVGTICGASVFFYSCLKNVFVGKKS